MSSVLAVCLTAMPREGYGQAWNASSNPVFLNDNLTNVGIGTNNPLKTLHLFQAQKIPFIGDPNPTFCNTGLPTLRLSALGDLQAGNPCPGITNNRINWDIEGSNFTLNFKNSDVTRMVLTSGGNVGIGTTSPNSLLSLGNSLNNTKLTLFQGASLAASAGIGWQTNQMRFHLNNTVGSFAFFRVENGTELVRFTGAGRNGFGTTTPLNRMDINGAMAVGSAYAGLVTAPVNGTLIEGKLGLGLNVLTPLNAIPEIQLLSRGNIAQVNSGTITLGPPALGDRWNALGDRIPFATTPGFASTGVRSQWDQYGANFGLIERQNIFIASTVRDGLVSWQDATTTADPNTLTANNSRLRFIFRNGNVPNVTPNALEAMTILANGRVGIRQNEPAARLQVEEGNIGQAETSYAAADGKWNSLGQEANISQYFGQFANWRENAVEMGLNEDASGETQPSINWYSAAISKKDLIFNYMDAYNIDPTQEIMRMRPDGIVLIGSPTTLTGSSGQELQVNGGGYTFTGMWTASDLKFKKNITNITNALETVSRLQGVSYDWRNDEFDNLNLESNTSNGIIAQELLKYIPNAVKEGKDGYLSVNYDAIIPVLVEALKELNEKVENLTEEKSSFRVSSTIKEKEILGHELFQNRPNPFSTNTVIDYQLGKEFRSAYIQVFEPTGKPLMKFENLQSGKNSIEVQAGNFSAGLYLYALVVDGRLIAQKSLIVE